MSDDQPTGSTKRPPASPVTEYPAASRARFGLSQEEENARLENARLENVVLREENARLRQENARLLEEENDRLRQDNARLRSNRPSALFQPLDPPLLTADQFMHRPGLVNTATLDSIIRDHSARLFTDEIEWLAYHGQPTTSTVVNDPEADAVEFQEWPEFEQEIAQFYQHQDVRRDLQRIYPIPGRTSKAYPSTEFSFASVVSEALNQTINRYFVEGPTHLYVTHQERTLCGAKSDFWFAETQFIRPSILNDPCLHICYAVMPIELKRPKVLELIRNRNIVDFLRVFRFSESSAPFKQITSYMLKSGSKYGVLTSCYQTWVLRKESNTVFSISPTQSQENWLKTMYFACWIGKKHYVDYSIPPKQPKTKKAKDKQSPRIADNDKDDNISATILQVSQSFSSSVANKGTSIDGSSSSAQQSSSAAIQPPHFPKIELEITDEILGQGRSGMVYLGYLKQQDESITAVAVKECKGDRVIQQEMVHEARVLLYANQRGVKIAPKIYYSGYYDDRFVNVVELYDSETYRQPDSWDDNDTELVIEAMEELKRNNIQHRDIRRSNVFFSREGRECKIIDYGFSAIMSPQPVTKQASLNDSGYSTTSENRPKSTAIHSM